MARDTLSDHTLAQALQRSEPLGDLLRRLRASRERLEAITPLLPAGLRAGLAAGPLDDAAWVLLAPNAAAAAKLRQMLPTLDAALAAAGWPGPPVKVKVRAPA